MPDPNAPQPADDAPLSIEAAAEAIGAAETPAAETAEALEPEEAPAAQADAADDAPEADAEAPPEAEPEREPIAAPNSWSDEDRAVFATLSPEAQEVIARREGERDKATQRSLQEAAQQRKAAAEAVAGAGQFRERIETLLTHAGDTFRGRWDGVDWNALAQQNPHAYVQYKAQHDNELAQLQQLTAAQQQAQAAELHTHVQQRLEALQSTGSDLVHPEKGPQVQQELIAFLRDQGVSDEQFQWASPVELEIALDAMRYRKLKADTAKRTAAAPPTPLRPAAGPQRAPKPALAAARERLTKSGRIEDAAAEIMLLQG